MLKLIFKNWTRAKNLLCLCRSASRPRQPGLLPRHHWGWDGGIDTTTLDFKDSIKFWIQITTLKSSSHCLIPITSLCRCVLGRGTHSWRSGTKQEWFDSGSTEFKFPTKFSTRQLVTRFKWRTATIGTDTCMCLQVPWSQKKVFWELSDSDLKWRQFQIWRSGILKPAKLQDSDSACQA